MNIEYASIFSKLRENNNPKPEINHYLIDEENIVVTDTRMLIVYKHGKEFSNRGLLLNQKCKYDMKRDEEDGFYDMGSEVFRFKKLINQEEMECKTDKWFNYPDYKRIISSTKQKRFKGGTGEKKYETSFTGVDALYVITSTFGVVIDYVKKATLLKALDKVHFTHYSFTHKNMPIMISNEELMVVIMPIIFEELPKEKDEK